MFELERKGYSDGNPFLDYQMKVKFIGNQEEITVDGFYDGDGVYRARFMPSFEGIYHYVISGNFADGIESPEGEFEAVMPSAHNHGPICVVDKIHLGYADKTPYYSIGTTCYAWAMQDMGLQEQTLKTLSENAFNKIRFCFFPKFYEFNENDPISFPFVPGHGEGLDPELVKNEEHDKIMFPGMKAEARIHDFDYTRPNVEHFKLFDLRIRQLMELGIEADMILMHPYDKWGINQMGKEACDAYLRYVVARYAAYRNVWWSLANEFDLILSKTPEDWERYGELVSEKDPYHHLLSIHNGLQPYDFTKPWITHCSLQRTDFYKTTEYTDEYIERFQKPVVWDEICYEGNIGMGWGNINGQELVRRFWEAFLRGGHCGHGETIMDPDDILWWSKGGILKGESPARLKFLLDILKEVPGGYLNKGQGSFDEVVGYSGDFVQDGWIVNYDYCIRYLGIMQPVCRPVFLPEDAEYTVDLIDTWNMTVTSLGKMSGFNMLSLPGKQYMAIRICKEALN